MWLRTCSTACGSNSSVWAIFAFWTMSKSTRSWIQLLIPPALPMEPHLSLTGGSSIASVAVKDCFARLSAFFGSTGTYAYEARHKTNARISGVSPAASPSAAVNSRNPRSCAGVSFGWAVVAVFFARPVETEPFCPNDDREADAKERNSRDVLAQFENWKHAARSMGRRQVRNYSQTEKR